MAPGPVSVITATSARATIAPTRRASTTAGLVIGYPAFRRATPPRAASNPAARAGRAAILYDQFPVRSQTAPSAERPAHPLAQHAGALILGAEAQGPRWKPSQQTCEPDDGPGGAAA